MIRCLERTRGGEIFVPKLPSYRILDVAKAIAPDAETKVVGIRPGEKVHEVLVPADEAWHSLEFDDHFVIQPTQTWWDQEDSLKKSGGKLCPTGFCYGSGDNSNWLSIDQLRDLVDQYRSEQTVG